MLLLFASAPAIAGNVTAFEPENVVILAPQEAPVSIASFDGFSDARKLYISVAFRNETADAIDGARVAMLVFDGERKVIGAAFHRAAGHAASGGTFAADFEVPLMRPIDAAWQVVVMPVEASTAARSGWRVPASELRPLVDRLRGSRWTGAQQALAVGADLIPRGELVQLPPPNCTLRQCTDNYNDCYYGCYDLIACAYCDRRREGAGCSTTCYCVGPTQECPPDPYL